MPTATEEVIKQLTHFGSQTGEFVQAQKGQSLAKGQVDKGFCTGVCIDWARRVLGGGRAAFTQKAPRVNPQTNRQATLQLNLKSRTKKYNEVIAVRNQLVEVSNNQTGQSCQISSQLQTELLKYLTFTVKTDRQYARSSVQQWLNLLGEIRDEYDRTTSTGWAALVGIMDELHRENRQLQSRGESNRKFSSIKVLKSSGAVGGVSVNAKIDSMLLLDEFEPGTVLLMGFDLEADGVDTGHAVAAFQGTMEPISSWIQITAFLPTIRVDCYRHSTTCSLTTTEHQFTARMAI